MNLDDYLVRALDLLAHVPASPEAELPLSEHLKQIGSEPDRRDTGDLQDDPESAPRESLSRLIPPPRDATALVATADELGESPQSAGFLGGSLPADPRPFADDLTDPGDPANPKTRADLGGVILCEDDASGDARADDTAPASSRRPVLPKMEAPGLPDATSWEEVVEFADPPPESGRQMAVAPLAEADSDVTGVRTAAVFHPEIVGHSPGDASPSPAPAVMHSAAAAILSSVSKSFQPVTFGALVDASLTLG